MSSRISSVDRSLDLLAVSSAAVVLPRGRRCRRCRLCVAVGARLLLVAGRCAAAELRRGRLGKLCSSQAPVLSVPAAEPWVNVHRRRAGIDPQPHVDGAV
jgi:hypothetical protein